MHYEVVVKDNSFKTKEEILNSYHKDFTNEELELEDWKCFDQIPRYFEEYMDIDTECTLGKEKMLYNYHNYYISTLGRIGILQEDNTILLKNVCINSQSGYLHLNIGKNRYRINRLMGFVFLDNDDPKHKIEVNHLNEIVTDNTISNLKWDTPKDNTNWGTGKNRSATIKSIRQKGRKHSEESKRKINIHRKRICDKARESVSRTIIRTDLNTNEVKYYYNCVEAAKELGCTVTSVNDCCRGKIKSFRGYTFAYLDGKGVNQEKNRAIVQLTPDTEEFVKAFRNTHEAKLAGFDTHYIKKCCRIKTKITNGFKWRYLDEYNQLLIDKGLDPIIL